MGLGLAEAALVFEELGRALVPGPLVASHLAAGLVDGADDGSVVVGLVEPPPVGGGRAAGHRAPRRSRRAVGGDRRRGRLRRSPSARRPPDSTGRWTRSPRCGRWTGCRRARRWPGPRSPPGGAGTALSSPPPSRWVRRRGPTELAVEYAKQRRQFGRPIGGFQAVKHLCADMAVRTEVARCAVHAAAVTVDQPEVGDAMVAAAGSQAAGRRGGHRQRPLVHPGPRGHGVHLGGPGPPGLQAGPGAGHPVRERRSVGRVAGERRWASRCPSRCRQRWTEPGSDLR